MICNNCGCQLIVGYTYNESDVKQSRYICKYCDGERRKQQHLNNLKRDKLNSHNHYINNKDIYIERAAKNRGKRIRYNEYKSKSKRKKISFVLTRIEFSNLINQPCFYCGQGEKNNGIDRLDNKKGYISDNCVPCCKRCNVMKNDMTLYDFTNHLLSINEVLF